MENSRYIKIVVFVPVEATKRVMDAMADTGAGMMGKYSNCFSTTRVTSRWKPEEGSSPHIGVLGRVSEVEEDRIETICRRDMVKDVINAIKQSHPYEEVSIDLFELMGEEAFN